MLSSDFVRDFRSMMNRHSVSSAFAKDSRGAHDAVTDPRLRRALARDRRDVAYDQGEGQGPHRDHVTRILDCVREALGDVARAKVERVIKDRWPESLVEDPDASEMMMDPAADDDADEDWPPANGNANRNVGGPKPFRGMPERGGGMAGDAALRAARRVRVDPYPSMMNGNGDPPMAFDSASEDDYEKLFPGVAARIGLL
jgi:hypothetical protein